MVFLLGAVACTSLVNIVLAFAAAAGTAGLCWAGAILPRRRWRGSWPRCRPRPSLSQRRGSWPGR